MASPNARRRQRSTRVTVAVALITIAALVVAGAAVGGSFLLTVIAAAAAVALGAAATKITHSELIQTRIEAARDRAEQAQAYRVLTDQRTAENEQFAATMTERIASRQQLIHELEGELALVHTKLAETTLKHGAESRRADQAETRLLTETAKLADAEQRAAEAIVLAAELEQEINDLKAELTAWETSASMPLRRHA
jgi:chromosome segregation ATPase